MADKLHKVSPNDRFNKIDFEKWIVNILDVVAFKRSFSKIEFYAYIQLSSTPRKSLSHVGVLIVLRFLQVKNTTNETVFVEMLELKQK